MEIRSALGRTSWSLDQLFGNRTAKIQGIRADNRFSKQLCQHRRSPGGLFSLDLIPILERMWMFGTLRDFFPTLQVHSPYM